MKDQSDLQNLALHETNQYMGMYLTSAAVVISMPALHRKLFLGVVQVES